MSLVPAGGCLEQAASSFLRKINPTRGGTKEMLPKGWALGPIRTSADPLLRGRGLSFSIENDFSSIGHLTQIKENP